jgi:hypothetical protein
MKSPDLRLIFSNVRQIIKIYLFPFHANTHQYRKESKRVPELGFTTRSANREADEKTAHHQSPF